MSVASLSTANSLGVGSYPVVIQQGVLTQGTANPVTVLCSQILATDLVLYYPITQTAPAASVLGTNVYTVAITAGTNFVATPVDNTMRGTYQYFILRSSARVLNATSA